MPHATDRARQLQCLAASLCIIGWAAAASAADAPLEPVTVRAVAHFGFDKTTIAPEDRQKILAEVGAMQNVTWQTVTATGHTDSVGSPVYNKKLAARRAAAVKRYLVGKGLDPAMIDTEAKADAVPLAPNDTEEGRSQNRRTEVTFRGVRTASAN